MIIRDMYILDEHDCPRLVTEDEYFDWQESLTGVRKTSMGFVLACTADLSGLKVVSTVYLGIDHSHDDYGPPVLWETIVFDDGATEQPMLRYINRTQAIEGHRDACLKYIGGPELQRQLGRMDEA